MSNINLGLGMSSLDLGLRQSAFTGVILHAGQDADGNDVEYLAGNTTGNVLEINVPDGTLAMAYTVLDGLRKRGYRYQPFESTGTITDPAIEIGDNVTVDNKTSVVLSIDMPHSRLMASSLKAPNDEEVNHEFKFETRAEREFRRETKYARSRLTINANMIESEVARASASEGELSSRITQNATEITAKVSKTGGSSSTFGWTLTDSDWSLFSGGATVFKATRTGVEVTGKITATSGYIGTASQGFEIGSRFIRNGMTSLSDTINNGVYVGTDGIALGGGKFKVDSQGNLTASSGTFSGNVYAGNIQQGGAGSGTMSGSLISGGSIGTGSGSPLSTVALGGISGGINFSDMENLAHTADWVACNHFVCYPPGNINGCHYGLWADDNETHGVSWKSATAATDVSGSFNGNNYYWFTATNGNDYMLPTSLSASARVTSTTTINHLGY